MSSKPSSPPGPTAPSPNKVTSRPPLNSEIELKDVVLVLRRRKGIIFTALVTGALIASVVVAMAHKEYSASATIEINKEGENSLGLPDLSGISSDLGGGDEVNMDLLTEQAVIMSDNTALQVIEKLKLDTIPPYAIPPSQNGKVSTLDKERGLALEQAPFQRQRIVSMFKSRLRVALIKGTRLLNITYTDTDPNRATLIANTTVDVYLGEYTQTRYDASSKTSSWLTGKLADLKDKVETSQAKVDEFQRESGLTGVTVATTPGEHRSGTPGTATTSDNVPLERLIELNRDLTNAEVSRIAREAIFRMTETQDPDVVLGIGTSSLASGLGTDSPLSTGSADLTLLQQLREQLAQVRVQLAAANIKYGARNPEVVRLQGEESNFQSQIRSELDRMRTRAKDDLDFATLAENGIRQQVAAQEQVVNKVTEKADQLILLQEEALSSREIYQDLYSKLEEATVTAGIRASNITLVNPARSPVVPSFPKTRTTIALGGIIGLVIGCLGGFLWDYFDDSITIPEQVEQITTFPIIGAVPDFTQKLSSASKYGFSIRAQETQDPKSRLWLLRAPKSHIAEAYRVLRTALLMSRADEPPRVILIVSGSPEEGKSTTCLNVAASFAIQGDRVLYLDADLRRATAHKFFDTPNEVGLSNCLTSGLPFEKALKSYPGIETLFLLSAGPHPPNPSELIGSNRFRELIQELRAHFDYVFIDSPPVLLVTDAQLISSYVDGYVLVLRSNKTTKRVLQRVLAIMNGTRALGLGIVVNAISARSAIYSGYGYYGSGSGYYVEEKD
jgi:succinoglycan biosynthesis transport protein ExoP